MLNSNRTPKDLRQRKGKVFIHAPYIDSSPNDILEILAHFVVVRIDVDFMRNGITYSGYSHLFDIIQSGEMHPQYDIILTRNWRGIVTTIKAIRRKGEAIYEFQSETV